MLPPDEQAGSGNVILTTTCSTRKHGISSSVRFGMRGIPHAAPFSAPSSGEDHRETVRLPLRLTAARIPRLAPVTGRSPLHPYSGINISIGDSD